MQFATLPTGKHPGALLRPLREDDIPRWAAYLNDPPVYQHTSWDRPSIATLRGYLGSDVPGDPASRLRLAIGSRADGRLLGTIGFHSLSPENRTAELAYDLHPEAWGCGLATCMARHMVQWAHSEVGTLRVQATVLQTNIRSIRTLERAGFTREGLLRSYRLVRGSPGNFFMYSHLWTD